MAKKATKGVITKHGGETSKSRLQKRRKAVRRKVVETPKTRDVVVELPVEIDAANFADTVSEVTEQSRQEPVEFVPGEIHPAFLLPAGDPERLRVARILQNRERSVGSLPPGTRFFQPDVGVVGVLIKANECRAHIKIERGTELVTVGEKTFTANRGQVTDWAPVVGVLIHPEQGDVTMAKETAAKAEKSSKVAVKCGCGCGEMTKPGSKFLQGHDARFHGRCRKLADGRLQWDDLVKELGKKGEYALPDYKEGMKHFPSTPPSKKKATAKPAKPAKVAKAGKKVVKKKVAKAKQEAAAAVGE